MSVDNPNVAAERKVFEAVVRAQYPAAAAAGAKLTLRRDTPGSTRFGQYVAEHIEFAWKLWQASSALAATQQAPSAVTVRPACPQGIVQAITAYGDARADQDANGAPTTSHLRLNECIHAIRDALQDQAAAFLQRKGLVSPLREADATPAVNLTTIAGDLVQAAQADGDETDLRNGVIGDAMRTALEKLYLQITGGEQ